MVRALDPEHLILGIRYKGVPDLALFTALSPFFDVNSINDYTRSGHFKSVYAALYQATGKPLMITEFSFSGFPSPGQPSALRVAVGSQANRGPGYQTYVRQAVHEPFSWWGCIRSCGVIMHGGSHGGLSVSPGRQRGARHRR